MYDLAPPAVYAHQTVMADGTFRSRAQRVVAALSEPRQIVTYSDADLPAMILEGGLLERRKPMGTLDEVGDPILLFNTFRFDSPEAVDGRVRALAEAGVEHWPMTLQALVGSGAFHWFDANLETDPSRHDKVCRPCWRIHLQQGCLHRCLYCPLGGLLVAMVNVEEYCEHLGRLIERHPWQQTYLLDDDGDPPCLEPELGTLGPLIEYFGTLDSRYLIIHTKTWNTAWMRDLRHNGNTIVVWSISGTTQSREIEPLTGTPRQRVEAARVAEQAGYTIRYKFKPIIPVRTWREDAAEVIRLLFEQTHPDLISLCVFMWMDVEEMKARLPVDLLDPDYLKAAEQDRERMSDTLSRPFPDWVRQEIYEHYLHEIRKYDPDIPVSLSTENFPLWGKLAGQLGMTATNYVCGCGPQSTPGKRKLDCHPFEVAVCDAEGIPGVVGQPE